MAAKEVGEKQIFGITIGIFAVALLVVGVLIYLNYSRLSKLNADTADYHAKYKAAQTIADTLKAKEKEKKETQDRVDECNQYLPTDDDIERTMLSFASKSTDAGLKTDSLKMETARGAVRPGQTKAPYETISYKGEFEGNCHQLAKFVSAIENWKTFKRFVSITTFSMKAASGGMAFDDGVQKHTIKMTLELYKYPEPAAKPAGPVVPGQPPVPGAR